ncbi:Glycine--tRNA ligase, partial [Stegodyphus mimosarum]
MFVCGYNVFRSCFYLTSLTPVLSAPVRTRSIIFLIHTFYRRQGGFPRTLPENWGKNRLKKYKIDFSRKTEDPKVQEVLQTLRSAVKEQEDFVCFLKESGAPELDLKGAGNELELRKKSLEAK